MTFQFINNTVIFLLTYVKQLIFIHYQSLNYAVNRLCSLWGSLFTNVYKCDVIMTSSATMNISNFYMFRLYHSLGIFTAVFVWIYTSLMEIWQKMWVGVFSEHSVVFIMYLYLHFVFVFCPSGEIKILKILFQSAKLQVSELDISPTVFIESSFKPRKWLVYFTLPCMTPRSGGTVRISWWNVTRKK